MEAAFSRDIPMLLIIPLIGALLVGTVLLVWGRKLPRQGDWLAGAALVGLFCSALIEWRIMPAQPEAWLRGWIGNREHGNAVAVGIIQDPLGLVMTGLGAIVSALFIVNRRLYATEERIERLFSAAVISTCGVALSWLSLTLWTAIAGIGIAALGGLMAFGSHWGTADGARAAARYARERFWGVVLIICGAYVLSSGGQSLEMVGGTTWPRGGHALVGAAILSVGILIQAQPFPVLGWLVMRVNAPAASRVVFAQVLPAWAALSVVVRMDSQIRATGVFSGIGWIALASAFLAVLMGLFQEDRKKSLGVWIAAGFSMALAALAFSGPWVGMAVTIGLGLAGCSAALWIDLFEEGGGTAGQQTAWVRTGVIMAACSASGLFGFISCGGIVRWFASSMENSAAAALTGFVIFLVALVIWKQAWETSRSRVGDRATWTAALLPAIPLILSFGFLWSGNLSGGALPGDIDKVVESAFDGFLGTGGGTVFSGPQLAVWAQFGIVAVAAALAYWSTVPAKDLWKRLYISVPRMAAFFSGGYGIDNLTARIMAGFGWFGESIDHVVGKKAWREWIPSALSWISFAGAKTAFSCDSGSRNALIRLLRKAVMVPAKLLQLLHGGDVQWYLFLMAAMAMALLAHFLRK